ncbi:MAG: transposase [Sandaracinaceae bacterium]|nr:transposase [Sandaracinaceae bacterium]
MTTPGKQAKTTPTVTAARRRTYDHRLRLAIAASGDATLFHDIDIPPSTRRSWTTRPVPTVVALHAEDRELVELQVALARVEVANAKLRAVVRLLLALVAVLGGRIADRPVPAAEDKARLLAAVRKTESVLGRGAALRVLGLTPQRMREWKHRALECRLQDTPSCPRRTPQQLTITERWTIREYVTDLALRHLSIASLSLLALRRGHAIASASTWCREVRRQGLRRPRKRVHPRRPKVGVRATAPNEIWHIDASKIRLVDGTVVWVHVVIDNYTRKILAWTMGGTCKADATNELLHQAVRCVRDHAGVVTVVTDGGSENIAVEDEDFAGLLRRVRAQVDVTYSNSLIESFWAQLKHRWLYLHDLDTEATLRKLIAAFVEDHNALIPRAVLGGRTPDEVFLGLHRELPVQLVEARRAAGVDRVQVNRALTSCGGCDGPEHPTPRGEVVDG